jgi:hypothetical protein
MWIFVGIGNAAALAASAIPISEGVWTNRRNFGP